MDRFLKRDAKNRAWRTVLQGFVAIILVPALDAALQVFVSAMTSGAGFDLQRTAVAAGVSAMTVSIVALSAYVHRMKIDGSSIPSATPPVPEVKVMVSEPTRSPRHRVERGPGL